jgi:hypothetical protein
MNICYQWANANISWINADWTWEECQVVQDIISGIPMDGVDATTLIQPWIQEPWNPYRSEKKKKLIRLICKIKGQDYDESKPVSDYKINVDDISMVVKKVANFDLNEHIKIRVREVNENDACDHCGEELELIKKCPHCHAEYKMNK